MEKELREASERSNEAKELEAWAKVFRFKAQASEAQAECYRINALAWEAQGEAYSFTRGGEVPSFYRKAESLRKEEFRFRIAAEEYKTESISFKEKANKARQSSIQALQERAKKAGALP